VINQKFPDKKEIGLATIGDIHLGSQTCNEKALNEWIAKIKKEKWYVILMGDLMENATLGSVGAVYEQTMTPQEQLRGMVDLLDPIKDYILGGVSGNHGARTVRAAGIDPDAIISFELGVPHFGYTGVGRVQVGGAHWYIVAHHGAGGGILQGSKLNMVRKLANIYPMADLYMAGHAHTDVSGSDRVFRIVNHHNKVSLAQHTRHFSGTGSLLDYQGSYAEAKLFPPAGLAQVVHFLGDRVHVSREEGFAKPYRREVFHF
jgi:hypothetical protein